MSILSKALDLATGAFEGTKTGLPAIPDNALTVQVDPRNVSFLAVARDYIDTVTGSSYFGPGQPLKPQAPPGTLPRVTDYPMTLNMYSQPRTEQAGPTFGQLRAFADAVDVLRLCIDTRKKQIVKIPLVWKVDRLPGEKSKDFDKRSAADSRVQYLTRFFEKPDQQHDWMAWLGMMLEEIFVTDALSVWPVMDDSRICRSLRILDGDFIKPLWDEQGWMPNAPNPAFSQQIKGMPAINMTGGECEQCLTQGFHTIVVNGREQNGTCTPLIYAPQNPRAKYLYGLSPVQMVMNYCVMAVNRMVSQTEYFVSGNTPEMIIQTPENWTVDQVERFQNVFDQAAGNLAKRRRVKFVPHTGAAPFETKGAMLKDDFDEWLARIFCLALHIPPTPFIRQLNRSTAQSTSDTSREEGTMGDLEWLEALMTRLARDGMRIRGVSAHFDLDSDPDPLKQAQIQDIKLKNGTLQIDEVREDDGNDPFGLPPGVLNVTTGMYMPFATGIATAEANAQHAINPPTPGQSAGPGQKQIGSGEQPQGEKAGGESATIKLLLAAEGGNLAAALRKKKVTVAY